MKLLLGTLVLGVAASAFGQEAVTAPAAPAAPRALVSPAVASDVSVIGVKKNAPFTADESGETVRIMPDGNRIVESWTGRIARNGEGRIRRDITSGKAGEGSRPMIAGGGIMPIAIGAGDATIVWSRSDAESAERRAVLAQRLGSGAATGVSIAPQAATEGGAVYIHKIQTDGAQKLEIENGAKAGTFVVTGDGVANGTGRVITLNGTAQGNLDGKFQVNRESLGTRDFGGVQAEGTRVTVTIAANAIGNDREIQVVSETWVSKDLGVVVYSKKSDPRTGETTYQMTNINRSEPDASLFPERK